MYCREGWRRTPRGAGRAPRPNRRAFWKCLARRLMSRRGLKPSTTYRARADRDLRTQGACRLAAGAARLNLFNARAAGVYVAVNELPHLRPEQHRGIIPGPPQRRQSEIASPSRGTCQSSPIGGLCCARGGIGSSCWSRLPCSE